MKRQAAKDTGAVKSLSEDGILEGYASVFDVEDLTNEIVRRGAFAKTVKENKVNGIALMARHLGHGGDIRDTVGVIHDAIEDSHGLKIHARFLGDEASQAVRAKVASMMKGGTAPGLSIGYKVIHSHPSRRNGHKVTILTELALAEVSLTMVPCLTVARVTKVKSKSKAASAAQAATRAKVKAVATRSQVEKMAKEAQKMDTTEATRRFEAARMRIAARALDHKSDDRIRSKIIEGVLFGGRSLSGREAAALEPKSESFKDAKHGAMVLPDAYTAMILGKGWARACGKTLESFADPELNPSLSNLLVPDSQLGPFTRSPLASPPLHELTTVVSTGGAQVLSVPGTASTDGNERPQLRMAWGHDESGESKTESEPVLVARDIATTLLSGVVHISERVSKRANVLPLLAILFRDSMEIELADKIINGSGIMEPLGILTAAGVRTAARDGAGTVTTGDFLRMKYTLNAHQRRNAIWIASSASVERLENELLTTGGRSSGGTFDADRNSILGHRHRCEDGCPPLGDDGTVIYGNPKAYVLGIESEFVVRSTTHLRFNMNQLSISYSTGIGGRPSMERSFVILTGDES